MHTWVRLLIWGIIFVCGAGLCAEKATPHNAGPGSELQGAFVFNSTKKDGKTEWKLEGSSATFLTPMDIEIKNARAFYYPEDGTNIIATTAKAVINKETRQVETDEFVTITTENSVTTATGMAWDQASKKASLKKDVKVIYSQAGGKGLMR
ncbi:MAG: LPS export ABC transporter periplasmic protein LptC [bacterium]